MHAWTTAGSFSTAVGFPLVSDSSNPSSDPSGTLYDPPEDALDEASEGEDTVALRLSLPPDRADRLRAVAQQLGLTPSLVARRAIELVCDEVVTVQDDTRSTHVLIDQYQARLDLLHSVEAPENGQLESPDDEANDE
jgi:hypothetical protein